MFNLSTLLKCHCSTDASSKHDDPSIIGHDYLMIKRPPNCALNRLQAWQRRYCVLERSSDTCNLHIYQNYKQYVSKSYTIVTVNIDNKTRYQVSSGASKKFSPVFILLTYNQAPLMLASTDSAISRKWMCLLHQVSSCIHAVSNSVDDTSSILYSSIKRPGVFTDTKSISLVTRRSSLVSSEEMTSASRYTVKIIPTSLSRESSIEGHHDLLFRSSSIAIMVKGSNDTMIDIPVSVIRKYGARVVNNLNILNSRKETLIEIEVGRKSVTGEGEFRFITNEGDDIIKHIRQMLHKQCLCKTNSCSSRETTAPVVTSASRDKQSKEKQVTHTGYKICTRKSTDTEKGEQMYPVEDEKFPEQTDYINYELIHELGGIEDTK